MSASLRLIQKTKSQASTKNAATITFLSDVNLIAVVDSLMIMHRIGTYLRSTAPLGGNHIRDFARIVPGIARDSGSLVLRKHSQTWVNNSMGTQSSTGSEMPSPHMAHERTLHAYIEAETVNSWAADVLNGNCVWKYRVLGHSNAESGFFLFYCLVQQENSADLDAFRNSSFLSIAKC